MIVIVQVEILTVTVEGLLTITVALNVMLIAKPLRVRRINE
jgi:hypothetical protein